MSQIGIMQLGPDDAWDKRKEDRVKVLLRVRMRAGGLPTDACIRDISSRGLLVQTAAPPSRGTTIELNGPFRPIVARVVWTSDGRFGVRTQDIIDVSALLSGKLDRRQGGERRSVPRSAPDRRADALNGASISHRLGGWMQFIAVAVIGGGIGIGLAKIAYETMSTPSIAIQRAFDGDSG